MRKSVWVIEGLVDGSRVVYEMFASRESARKAMGYYRLMDNKFRIVRFDRSEK